MKVADFARKHGCSVNLVISRIRAGELAATKDARGRWDVHGDASFKFRKLTTRKRARLDQLLTRLETVVVPKLEDLVARLSMMLDESVPP